MVNLELYKVFHTVAKCGSLTRAAELLYISQPAVSQAIKQLEGQLGCELFHRTYRGMELTAQGGKLIYRDVEEALGILESVENRLSEIKSVASGTIRIGATDSIFAHILSERIVEYHERYPAVKIELVTGTSPETIEQLKSNRVDIGFLNLPVEDNGIELLHTVAHLNDIFVANDSFAQLKGKCVTFAQLQSLPLLMIESNTIARRVLNNFTRNLGIKISPDIEVGTWDFMIKLVIKGMGLGCIPREYCSKQLESGELFEVTLATALPARGVGLAVPKGSPLSFAAKAFVNLFIN